jgi:hypothetical protein
MISVSPVCRPQPFSPAMNGRGLIMAGRWDNAL